MALEAWRKAKKRIKRFRQSDEDIIIHHDQDGVCLRHGWLYEVAVEDKALVSHSYGILYWKIQGKKSTVFLGKRTL